MPELHDPRDPHGPDHSRTSEDALASALKDVAAAGQTAAAPVPVAAIMKRGDRVRRRRTVAYAVAACLAVGGTGLAAAAVLPFGGGTVAPATSPSGGDSGRESPSPQKSPTNSTEPGGRPSSTSTVSTTSLGLGTVHSTGTLPPERSPSGPATSVPPPGSTPTNTPGSTPGGTHTTLLTTTAPPG